MRSTLYVVWNNKKITAGFSHNPLLDFAFYYNSWGCQQLWLISPLLKISQAAFILPEILTVIAKRGVSLSDKLNGVLRLSNKRLEAFDIEPVSPKLYTYTENKTLQSMVFKKVGRAEVLLSAIQGRLLFLEEIEQFLEMQDVVLQDSIMDLLQLLYLQEKLQVLVPSVGFDCEGNLVCQRCGSVERLHKSKCIICGSEECWYCEKCVLMGDARECRALYGATVPKMEEAKVTKKLRAAKLDFPLTVVQGNASDAALGFVKDNSSKRCLIWAACGAGKTEVVFEAIMEMLSNGGRVLFAVPRRDTVVEVAKRIKKAFLGLNTAVLYGGSEERFKKADLVVATTHQALRFYKAFHLIILDEVDAFPYHENEMLYNTLQRAIHADGKIIYMTATPPEYLLKMKESELKRISLPARYHGYPVPVPKIFKDKRMIEEKRRILCSEDILDFLRRSVLLEGLQVLVFVPTVKIAEKTAATLKEEIIEITLKYGEGWIDFMHSRDPWRDKKRDRFLNGEFPVLVTTTVMERGITASKINVLVVFADNDYVFDMRTLVQLAGRAGRTLEYPQGEVWFAGSKYTNEMKMAVKWIKELNAEAYAKGYIKQGG